MESENRPWVSRLSAGQGWGNSAVHPKPPSVKGDFGYLTHAPCVSNPAPTTNRTRGTQPVLVHILKEPRHSYNMQALTPTDATQPECSCPHQAQSQKTKACLNTAFGAFSATEHNGQQLQCAAPMQSCRGTAPDEHTKQQPSTHQVGKVTGEKVLVSMALPPPPPPPDPASLTHGPWNPSSRHS